MTDHPLTPENLIILREWVKMAGHRGIRHLYAIQCLEIMAEIGVWVHAGRTSDAVFGPGWCAIRGIGHPWHFTEESDLARAEACFFEWKLRLA